jgi:cation diffusion facilitator family transporter
MRWNGLLLGDERIKVALISLMASVLLSLTKLIAYFVTGSLSVLAEFLHSSLDLMATLVTLSAVYYAARPPDSGHPYGHGKAENLGGLAGALLILATSVWIFYEGVERLTGGISFNPSIVAVGVMAVSIAMDFWRSRALYSTARKYGSQALEADALHFSSDLVSSGAVLSVVAVGIVLRSFPVATEGTLVLLDVGVAMLVAAYFGLSSYRLSRRAVSELLDKAPKDIVATVERIARSTEGVIDVKAVRSRRSGPRVFVDMSIFVAEDMSISRAHETASRVESAVKAAIKEADLVIHIEPPTSDELKSSVISKAMSTPGVVGVHNVMISQDEKGSKVRLHVNVDSKMTVAQAHKVADDLESKLKSDLALSSVTVHTEPYARVHDYDLLSSIKVTARRFGAEVEGLTVETIGQVTYVDVTCRAMGSDSLERIHDAATLIEDRVKELVGGEVYVTVHLEPSGRGR